MLNPFAIEKDIFNRTSAIRTLAENIRLNLCFQTIKAFGDQIDVDFKKDIQQCTVASIQLPKKYVCKICNKEFNDGRRLGGHVSRAHKNEVGASMIEEEQQEQEIYISKKMNLRNRIPPALLIRQNNNKMQEIYEQSYSN